VTVEFVGPQEQALPKFTKQLTITVWPPGRDTVVFVSDQSITPQNL
jgi:hypothetical protein